MTMCKPLQPPDLKVGQAVSHFTAASEGCWIACMDVHAHEGTVSALVSDGKRVSDWLLSTSGEASQQANYVGHDEAVTALSVSPDGSSLYTASWDNFVRIFGRPGQRDDAAAMGAAEEAVAEAKAALDAAHASKDPVAYSAAKEAFAAAEATQHELLAARESAFEASAEIRCAAK